jgi:hypothetical protein
MTVGVYLKVQNETKVQGFKNWSDHAVVHYESGFVKFIRNTESPQ